MVLTRNNVAYQTICGSAAPWRSTADSSTQTLTFTLKTSSPTRSLEPVSKCQFHFQNSCMKCSFVHLDESLLTALNV